MFFSFKLFRKTAAAAKSIQSCPTLCDPIDSSPPGSPVPGILQARTLEWVAISFSNAWKWKVKVKSLSRLRLFANPWTAAHQAPPSMGFSWQEYWSGVRKNTYSQKKCITGAQAEWRNANQTWPRYLQIKGQGSNVLWEKSQRESNAHNMSELKGPGSLPILSQYFVNEENKAQIRN